MRGIQKCNCHFTTAKHLEFFLNTAYQEKCDGTKLKYRGAGARINHGKILKQSLAKSIKLSTVITTVFYQSKTVVETVKSLMCFFYILSGL